MDILTLEQYYKSSILPLFSTPGITDIAWKDHGKVGLDTWAHHFEDQSGREFVLIYEDFPGNEYMADDPDYSVIPAGEETILKIVPSTDAIVDNVFGYFTLYAENRR